jgi:hypothetical protein
MEFPDFNSLGLVLPMVGGARGYNVEGDVLTQTVDGRDLNDLWNEFQATITIQNERRTGLVEMLTFPVTNVIEDVPQIGGDDFEEASEFGEPKGIRPALSYFSLAYDFKWYDIAARYTWKFLAEASAQQIEAVHQSVLDADNRLVFKKVMNTLFNNVNRSATIKGQNYTVFSLYNADGTVPPDYKGNTFNGSHTHYLSSGAAAIDSGDVEALIDHLKHHGYSAANGTQLVLLVTAQEAASIRTWRANVTNANAAVATYDFIPSQGSPGLIVPNAQGMLGTQVPNTINGMPVIGSYGPALIVEEEYIPAGYIVLIGTGGEGGLNNPVGLREHANPGLRGLRLINDNASSYPLVDSFYSRGFGTGIRQRGGAAVMRISASAYAIPSQYA